MDKMNDNTHETTDCITYCIKIMNGNVYINDELCYYSLKMDKDGDIDDLNKKALVSLADKMGYESTFLFEEIVDRLYGMLDEMEDDEENGNSL